MGKMRLIVASNCCAMTYAEVVAAHANDVKLISFMEQVPKAITENEKFIIKEFPRLEHIFLTDIKNINNEKINSLPYNRRTRRSDISSKQLRAKPLQTTKL